MQTEKHLRQPLIKLRARLLVMCQAVSVALDNAGRALLDNNYALAESVLEGDAAIDALEDEIDEMSLAILALNQPVAKDLRFVVSALRMVIDLERIGDEAVVLAERVIFASSGNGVLLLPEEGIALLHKSRHYYEKAIQAFKREDCKAISHMFDEDLESTQAEVAVLQKVLQEASVQDPSVILQVMLVARALNRIWRRSGNIVEHAWFVCRGESIKHRRLRAATWE